MSNKSTIVRTIQIAGTVASSVAPGLAARVLERQFLTTRRGPTPEREQRWMQGVQRSTATLGDGRGVPLYTWGDPGRPRVLLVHGWSGRGSQLAVFARPLVDRGYCVITYDAPGHGDAAGRSSSLPELASVVQEIAAAYGPLHAVVAHSLGAAATTIAVARGLEVARLVYLAPPEDPGHFLDRVAQWLGLSASVTARAQARIEQRIGLPFAHARGTTLVPSRPIALRVIHDHDDHQVPYADGVRLVRAWPGAELVTTHGLGHNRIVRDPAVVATVVGFVTRDLHQAAVDPRPRAVQYDHAN